MSANRAAIYDTTCRLFGSVVELRPGLAALHHALPRIRQATFQAALGRRSVYTHPAAMLEQEIRHYVRDPALAAALLTECQSIAASAARAGEEG